MGMGNIANTGMRAAMTNMEAISNNIANANTVGFKRSRVNFIDLYPAGNGGASGNAVGLGVSVSGIDQNFSTGGIESTGINSDLSISRNGFFVMSDASSGQTSYTRAGHFQVDNNGYLYSLYSGARLQGYPATNGQILPGSVPQDIQINVGSVPATASTTVSQQINLNANSVVPAAAFDPTDPATFNYQTQFAVYDSLGNQTPGTLYYIKTAANNWDVQIYVDGNNVGSGTLTFNTSGALTGTTGLNGVSYNPTTGATSPQTFDINLAGSTQYAKDSSSSGATTDGFGPGSYSTYNIDKNGIVTATYSNRTSVVIAQVAVATFLSPTNLQNIGTQSWLQTTSSGEANVNMANSTNNIQPGALEMSNVDLTTEMVNLLSAQYTFQANAQVETTYNQVMQTILNL